jgi:hypothetical protein
MRTLLIIALLLAAIAMTGPTADAQLMITNFGEGSTGFGTPIATCSGTGLKFNVACNSQYIGVL